MKAPSVKMSFWIEISRKPTAKEKLAIQEAIMDGLSYGLKVLSFGKKPTAIRAEMATARLEVLSPVR